LIYECLVKYETACFIVARPAGHPWTPRERAEFEIIPVEVVPQSFDAEYIIHAECGDIPVMASAIDPALVIEGDNGY
jgi:hypothetical protein